MSVLKSLEILIKNSPTPMALVNAKNDKIVISNEQSERLFIKDKSDLTEMIEDNDEPVIQANLMFCKYVESVCKTEGRSVISHEVMGEKSYIVLRNPIEINFEHYILMNILEVPNLGRENKLHLI
ncbi:hypothetical protein [Vibrio alfacsensis]|uniref:hypothetical protein n=1 Tax=Vibrio alfacsensis TaxID=1074311 RepID=UPI001BEDB81C|nr:hypothetical protein [Vibrio alfacsensis]BCN24305.1 hypothetical protein VYA_14970 [Vibrio alfacsensis]